MPKNLEIEYNDRMKEYEEEKKVGYMTMSESIGYEKGINVGIGVGIEKGKMLGGSNVLLLQLNAKFKKIPKRYLDLIEKADEAKLRVWSVKLLSANVIEDIFSEN